MKNFSEWLKCDRCGAINLLKSKYISLFTPSFKYSNVGYISDGPILKLKFRLLYVLESTNNYCHGKKTQMTVCYGDHQPKEMLIKKTLWKILVILMRVSYTNNNFWA